MRRRATAHRCECYSEKIVHPGPIANDPNFLNVAECLHVRIFHLTIIFGECFPAKGLLTGNHKDHVFRQKIEHGRQIAMFAGRKPGID